MEAVMRRDMAKVIVERPRTGGFLDYGDRIARYERRCRDRSDPYVLPMRMPMRFARTKNLNENLAPLIRFLRGAVGRRWDEVHAEIRAHLRVTNPVQLHVMQHVDDFVYFARREGHRIVLTTRRGWTPLVMIDGRVIGRYSPRNAVYVCCDTGRVCTFARR